MSIVAAFLRRCWRLSLEAPLLLGLAVLPSPARSADAPDEETSMADAGGDGLRGAAERRGIAFEGRLLLDATANLEGGARRGAVLRSPLAVSLDLDGERLAGWSGTRAHLEWRAHQGGSAADLVGDAQGVDNVDALPFRRLLEAWVEQGLAGGRARIKAGLADANTEFALIESAAAFTHSSAGFSPTIVGFPSYPAPAPVLAAFGEPAAWLHLGGGAFVVRDSAGARAEFFVVEAAGRWRLGGRPGRLALGRWRHGGAFARTDGAPARGTGGHYAVIEQAIVPSGGGESGPALFLQAGEADGRVADLDRHLAVGIVWPGPWPGRPDDTFGVLVTSARLGAAASSAGRAGLETAFEIVYDARFGERLGLKGDLQLVVDPGGAGRRPALVASLRVELRF